MCNSDGIEATICKFEEPLLEYVRILGSVKAALSRRENKKQAYYNALIDLDAKLAAYNKALGVPGKEDVANQKQLKVEDAQSHLDRSKEEYEKVSRVLMDEFESFKAVKAVELRDIAQTFVKLQVSCCFFLSHSSSVSCSLILFRVKSPPNRSAPGKISPRGLGPRISLPPLRPRLRSPAEMELTASLPPGAAAARPVTRSPPLILERRTTR